MLQATIKDNPSSFLIGLSNLELKLDCNHLPRRIEESFWIMKYNIDILTLNQEKVEETIITNAPYWDTFERFYRNETGSTPKPWYNYYTPLSFFIDNKHIEFSSFSYRAGIDLLLDKNNVAKNTYTFSVFSEHVSNLHYLQAEYDKLHNNSTPYNLIFVQDGDYLDMYIDSVRSSNYIFTYVRGTKEMAKEIENFVRREPYDPSKILWPRHANGTSDYDDQTILDHKTGNAYLTLHDSTIRTEPDSSSDIVADIKKDDVVTILEKNNSITINDIQSNWLKVKTDTNQTGWVFGGDISLNDATSREEQERYEAEHAELLKVAQQYQEKLEQERKAEEEQKAIEQKAQALRDEEERLRQEAMDKLIDFDVFLYVTGGMLVFIILLIVVILILKSKKKNRKSK
ncbi:SH3 domain-containing protein [Spirochaeta cellobiosiphila]|uniref:SH3 domain-containing protein n=1 Tax=Spirochaeta cellobiosiphila TaxID=504483 RepID=UPI00048F4599|nr:SH3 domain-containing protein [Spirochaeta cellobiosiphila]